MTDRLDELDATNFTTGLGNWAKQRRDAAIAHLTRNGAGGGQALGRYNARLVANKLYRAFNEYLARGGARRPDATTLTGFIQRFWPSTIPELAQDFPNIIMTAPAAPPAAPSAAPTAAPAPAATPAAPAAVAAPRPAPAAATPTSATPPATAPAQPSSAPAAATPAPEQVPDWTASRNQWRAARGARATGQQPDVDQQLRDIGRKIVQRVQAVGDKRAADDPEIQNLEAEQKRLLAQREGRSPRGHRLVEADPSLSIPQPPSTTRGATLNFGRKGVTGPPATGPAQAGTPPAFLSQQRNITGSGTLNRAQIDRVFYALAYLLIDSGHASIDGQAKPNQANQPRSVAGQTMANGGGFGRPNMVKTLQAPLSYDGIIRSQAHAPATARIPSQELSRISGLLSGKSMTMSELINSMGKMSSATVQGLLLATEFA